MSWYPEPSFAHLERLSDDTGLLEHAHGAGPLREHGIETIALSLGLQLAGALVNNNYPAALLDLSIPGEPVVDLGALCLRPS